MLSVGEYVYNILKIDNGFYVDVGAWDGISMDETLYLERLGWNGICIEGHPTYYAQLCKNRRAQTHEAFVAGSKSQREILIGPGCGSGIKGNMPEGHDQRLINNNHSIVIIETELLEDILDKLNAPQHIHLLKSDTEGSCLEIIKSLSFTKYTFDFISVELGLPNTIGVFEEGVTFLQSKGYQLIKGNLNQNDIFQRI